MRDGVRLLAHVTRPAVSGRFPALVDATTADRTAPSRTSGRFFAARGYVQVIAALRGTGGSEGVPGLFDATERMDLFDLVEWAAAQPWCDGKVAMVGFCRGGSAQLGAATTGPPHLVTVFATSATPDLYRALHRNGIPLPSGSRATHVPHGGVSRLPAISTAALAAARHPVHDEFWDERTVSRQLQEVDIPVFLAARWGQEFLPGSLEAWTYLVANPLVRMALHIDDDNSDPLAGFEELALEWLDHWLRGLDNDAVNGSPVSYQLVGAHGHRRTAAGWPPGRVHLALALNSAGKLLADGSTSSPSEQRRCDPAESDRRPPGPDGRVWESAPLTTDEELVGEAEVRLDATIAADDCAWSVLVEQIGPDGTAVAVTSGALRASLREVDPDASRPGSPWLPCRSSAKLPPGVPVAYRIPLLPMAHRIAAGHRIRLTLRCEPWKPDGSEHGESRPPELLCTVHDSSRLLVPVLRPPRTTAAGLWSALEV